MAYRNRLTTFIIKGDDFFIGYNDNGSVRIGMVGGTCFDIPTGHAYYARIIEANNEAEAEEYFDELFGLIGRLLDAP